MSDMNNTIEELVQSKLPPPSSPHRPLNIQPIILPYNKTAPLSPMPASPTTSGPAREQIDQRMAERALDSRVSAVRAPSRERMDREARSRPGTRDSDERSRSSGGGNTLAGSKGSAGNGSNGYSNMVDFFGGEVFQIVIHNPTTAHRFLRFCQSRNCGENMEFLQKVQSRLICGLRTRSYAI